MSVSTTARTRDGLLRDTGFALMAGSSTEAATAWTYDNAGRASSMNATSTGAAPQTFTYQWVAGRPQLIDRVIERKKGQAYILNVLTPYDTANATGGTVYTRDVLSSETSSRGCSPEIFRLTRRT
jgi:hypothetical protein